MPGNRFDWAGIFKAGRTLDLYGYIGFMVPFFFAAVAFAIALRGWEGRLSERVLPFYVRAGWLSPPEVATLTSLARRHSARRQRRDLVR